MRGLWTLAHVEVGEEDWLLLKKADSFAGTDELIERYPQSVISGLTLEEIADLPAKLSELREHLQNSKHQKTFSARSQPLMLATLQERSFSNPNGFSKSNTTACESWPSATATPSSFTAAMERRSPTATPN